MAAKKAASIKGNKKEEKKNKKGKKSKSSKKASDNCSLRSQQKESDKKVPSWSHEPQIQYRLSDSVWVKKGWTVLPRDKIIHKVVTYKTVPAKPHKWPFRKRPSLQRKNYPNGAAMAAFERNGLGSIYYPDGRVAMKSVRGTKCVRLIVFQPSKLRHSSGSLMGLSLDSTKTPGRKQTSPSPGRYRVHGIAAMFDSWGNGVVYDEYGNIRLNYTQRQGALIDSPSELTVKWKWPVKFTKGDSVENLGTQETLDDGKEVEVDKDSDDEEKKEPELQRSELKTKTSKKGSVKSKSSGTSDSKCNEEASATSSKVSKGSKLKKIESISRRKGRNSADSVSKTKLEAKSSSWKKTKRSRSGRETDNVKMRTAEGEETDGGRVCPAIAEDGSELEECKMADDRFTNLTMKTAKQQIGQIHALQKKYFIRGVTPLKPIVLKVNSYITLRIMDQSNVSLTFHAHNEVLRLELGCVVEPSETVKVNKVDPTKWFEDFGVPCQIELFAKHSIDRYKTVLNRQRELGVKRDLEQKEKLKRFGGIYCQ